MRGSVELLVASIAATGCSSFEDPDIVLDLRVIAVSATPPEQVVAIDLSVPQPPSELLQQLVPAEVCALVTDPELDRRLRYRFTLCLYGDDSRCDPDIMTSIGAGVIEDPDLAPIGQTRMCATVFPNSNLLGVLSETLEDDPFQGLGGLDYLVQFTVGGEDADPALDEYAAKTLRVAPKLPVTRTANVNPWVDGIVAQPEASDPAALPLGRCVDRTDRIDVAAGTKLRLTPIEPADARETYVVPTIDGKSMVFTESLTYQWLATAGGFSSGTTGGTRDVSGNPPPLFTEWRAPRGSTLSGSTDVQLWMIQRDERYGVTWYEACLRVMP